MLRPIKCDHYLPRVVAGKIINTAGTPSVSAGCQDDVSSVTDNATGDQSVNLSQIFKRKGASVVTSGVGTGSISNITSNTAALCRSILRTEAGTAVDGTGYWLSVGFDHALSQKSLSPATVVATRHGTILEAGDCGSTGTMGNGKYRFTAGAVTSTFTLTPTRPFGDTPIVLATARSATAKVCNVTSTAVNSIVVDTFDAAGSGSAAAFNFLVLTKTNAIRQGLRRSILQTTQKGGRLVIFEVTYTTGTPAITVGSEDGAIVDNGTGDFSITLTKPFKRHANWIASPDSSHICTDNSGTSLSVCNILTFSNAGAAVDPGVVYVIGLGYDYADEF